MTTKCCDKLSAGLDQVGHVQGHFLHLRVIEGLNVFQGTMILGGNKVDGDTLTAETSSTTDSGK